MLTLTLAGGERFADLLVQRDWHVLATPTQWR
jgi:hypothetical protein